MDAAGAAMTAEPTEPKVVYDLPDYFSATIHLQISQPQPQYNLVQLNAMRDASDQLISCDVNRDDFLNAIEHVLDVKILDRKDYDDAVAAIEYAAAPTGYLSELNLQWTRDTLDRAVRHAMKARNALRRRR